MLLTSYPFFVKQSLEIWHRNNGTRPLCARLLLGLLEYVFIGIIFQPIDVNWMAQGYVHTTTIDSGLVLCQVLNESQRVTKPASIPPNCQSCQAMEESHDVLHHNLFRILGLAGKPGLAGHSWRLHWFPDRQIQDGNPRSTGMCLVSVKKLFPNWCRDFWIVPKAIDPEKYVASCPESRNICRRLRFLWATQKSGHPIRAWRLL